MWLRAYCPQACYAAGPGPFRYLLYKDVNRHAAPARPRRLRPALTLSSVHKYPTGSRGGVKPPLRPHRQRQPT